MVKNLVLLIIKLARLEISKTKITKDFAATGIDNCYAFAKYL